MLPPLTASEKTRYESKPSKKVVVTWFFTLPALVALVTLVILTGLTSATLLYALGGLALLSGGSGFLLLLANGLAFLFPLAVVSRYFICLRGTYNYKITDRGVHFNGGILVKKQTFVPFSKITNTEIVQNVVEQVLGISRIGFQTAGASGLPFPEIVFEGIEDTGTPTQLVHKFIEKTTKSSTTA